MSSEQLQSWRTNITTMPEKWAAALANNIPGIEHDVRFLVGEDEKPISCHKLVLGVCSPVFQTMFSAPFKTEAGELTTTINVPDLHFNGMTNILKYAYTGGLDVNITDALTTMYAANKYDIPEVLDHCSGLLRNNLSNDNAVTIYQSAVILNDMELVTKAEKYILGNFQKIMQTNDFLEYNATKLDKFIQMDNLNVHSEINLFNGILKWAKHQLAKSGKEDTQSNLKDAIGDLVKHIRFPTMTSLVFTKQVEPTGILTDKDCYNLFKYFSLSTKDRLSLTMSYNTIPRMLKVKEFEILFWDKAKGVLPVYRSNGQHYHSGVQETRQESFQVTALQSNVEENNYQNNMLCLKGISLLAPQRQGTGQYGHGYYPFGNNGNPYLQGDNTFHVTVNLSSSSYSSDDESFENKDTLSGKATFHATVNPGELYGLTFKKPIKLLQGSVYTINVTYIKGVPGDINSQTSRTTMKKSAKYLNIEHYDGNYIVAAMKLLH